MKSMRKLNILLTNDDGINAPGIESIKKALEKKANITIVAPLSEKSAVGHAITISDPLRVEKIYKDKKFFGFGVSGTPADCVKIACIAILKKKPDMVISGINFGPNLGISVLYSGTVSGATEAAILGVPALAVSIASYKNPKFDNAAWFIKKLVEKFSKNGLPKKMLLNINVPNLPKSKIKGFKVCRQDIESFIESFEKRIDPRNRVYYWLRGNKARPQKGDMLDVNVVSSGYISIVPIQYDLTDYANICAIDKILKKKR